MTTADHLATIKVSELDLSRYVVVGPDDTVSTAVEAMRDSGFSSACVVDGGDLVGIFTQRDVLMRVLGRPGMCERSIGEEMTHSPRTMTADQSVAEGLAIMQEWWVRSVPVVDDQGGLLGSLSWYTVMQTMAEFLSPFSGEQAEASVEHGLAFVDFTGLNIHTPVIVSESETADVAMHQMQVRAIGSVLVVDQRESLVGIISEFDLLRKLACTDTDLSTVTAGEIMTHDVVSLSVRSSIGEAIRKMADRGFSHAPLIGESNRPVGVASFREIASFFETSLESLA